jgi:peptide/nickel transport system substrate-binding protein
MERFWASDISRRSLLRGAALGGVGLATAAVIGCDDDDDDDDDGSASSGGGGGGSRTTGSFTVGIASRSVPNLDPNSTVNTGPVYGALFDQLVRLDENAGLQPGLAESWEIDDNNQKRWIYNLREAEWSDGVAFTAEDVKFAQDYIKNPDNKSNLVSRVSTEESSEIIDDHTIAIITADVDPSLPRRTTLQAQFAKHIFGDASKGPEFAAINPVGTGSYVVKSYVRDTTTVLTENPGSWRGTAGMTEVTLNEITETTTRLAAYEVADLDYVQNIPIAEQARIGGLENSTIVQVPPTTSWSWDISPFKAPTSDPRVRFAIIHAIDYDTINETIMAGSSEVMQGQILHKATPGHNPNLKPWGFDPEKSRQMLKDAGFANGVDLKATTLFEQNAEQKPWGEACASMWEDVGFNISLNPVETNLWREQLYGRAEHDHLVWSTFSSQAIHEPSTQLQWYLSDHPSGYYDNQDFDAALKAARATIDPEERNKAYWPVTQIMHDDPPAGYFISRGRANAYYTDKFGAPPRVGGNSGIYLDEIVPV